MSHVKCFLEHKIYELSAYSGYDAHFLMGKWNDICDEAAEDGESPDWDQFCGIAMDHDF